MIIVPVGNLSEGMILAKDVASTSARDYRTLLMRGTMLTEEMIALLKTKGIKSVAIEGRIDPHTHPSGPEMGDIVHVAVDVPVQQEDEEQEEVMNEHISKALTQLENIFDENHEVKELSQVAVKQVDAMADDIIADIGNDSSYLGNQMIALQNYDDYTYKHCLRVAMLSTSISAELGLSPKDIKEVVTAALLHDIGKSGVEHDIIIKPGKLTDEEFEKIKEHPVIGYNTLKRSKCYNSNIMSGVLFHQEKYDGSGYPTGVKGQKIPLIARIITVADVFDALTSNRPYRKPWSVAETEEYMQGACGSHFDFEVVAAFLRAFNPYPVGTVINLSDGRQAVVIKHNQNVLRPVVRIVSDIGMGAEEVDLANDFRFLSVMVTGIYNGKYEKMFGNG